jgi:SAM-dependent MidA family methyltransferase
MTTPTSAFLLSLIIERIQREGPISFAEYMRMALYEPGYGYYVTNTTRVGWEGDFYTSTDVSDLFAHCMGRQLLAMWQLLGQPERFYVLEQGAGRGHLAMGVQAWAQREEAAFAAALDYQHADMRMGQDALREPDANEQVIHPHVLLSNELVDAFPVHVVEVRDQHLYEVYVDIHHGRLHEVLDAPSSGELEVYLERYKVPWQTFGDGWRAEINLDALRWMEQSARLLPAATARRKQYGFLLAIDYGDKARALYTAERRRGTLACYFQHQLTERPLHRPGEQDITAHVNFSALIEAGRQYGLRLHQFATQREWLIQYGIYDELERIRQHDFSLIETSRASDQGQVALLQWYNLRHRVAALTDMAGMGNFKVLIMKR